MKTLNDDQSLIPTSPMVNGSSEFPHGEALGDQFLGPVSTVIDRSSPSSHSKALANQSVSLVPSILNLDGAFWHISDAYEPLIDLSLEIEDVDTLPRTLESFTKVEKIENPEMKFTRDNCKEEESIKADFEGPLVAASHLKRFKTYGTYVEKIDKHVEFPLELDLLPYTKGREHRHYPKDDFSRYYSQEIRGGDLLTMA
ncbi:hypothetical protein AAG906_005996 [Vitis piasezkii]